MFSLLLALIYLAFISLGLPDSLLGSAWPSIYPSFNVPFSYAGIISIIICCGTIISSLCSGFLNRKFSAGVITVTSVGITALALFGFSTCSQFWMLCIWAIPYGLGAGSVDATLNNYVSNHFSSFHMSMLHCMWGVGASIGPYIMSFALTYQQSWQKGYLYICFIQIALTFILLISLPVWKKKKSTDKTEVIEEKVVVETNLFKVLKMKGVALGMLAFFLYCALEQTTGLWASSYFVLVWKLDASFAASLASLFYIGITVGRFISAFISLKLNEKNLVRLGQGIILVGIIMILIPASTYYVTVVGLVLVGLGCAPIFPSMIHAVPARFGKNNSQSIIGLQMAFSYFGTLVMPPLYGVISSSLSNSFYPYYLLICLVFLILVHQLLIMKTDNKKVKDVKGA